MTNQNLNQSSPEESTISRQTRNAFAAALIFTAATSIGFIVSLQISLSTRAIISFADTIIVFAFFVYSIISARLIRKGQKEKGVWVLLISFVIALALRNALTAGLGVIFGIFAVVLAPFIGLLTLKPETFNRTLALGIFSGSFYLIFDILVSRYLPPYRRLSEDVEMMVRIISILVVVLTLIYIFTLIRQHRFLLLSSKLTQAMIFIVLGSILMLSIASTISLENSLGPRQDENMQLKAAFVARSIDSFIDTTKNALRAESRSPALVEYLLSHANQEKNQEKLEEQALETLRSFRIKDVLLTKSYAILDISGRNILDTSLENIGNDEHERDYFIQVLEKETPAVSDVMMTEILGEYSLFFSAPIRLKTGEVIGVIRVEYDPYVVRQHIHDYIKLEEANEQGIFAALISEKQVLQIDSEDPALVYLVLANSKNPNLNFMSVTPLTTTVITPLQMDRILPAGSTAQLTLDVPGLDAGLHNRFLSPVFEAQAFPRESDTERPLDVVAAVEIEEETLRWTVIVSQDLEIFNAPFQRQNETLTILAVLIAVGAAFFAYSGSRYLISPIMRLTEVSNKITQGDLSVRAVIDTEDEIGALGKSFNNMTIQLDTLITTLDNRVAERTRDLERSAQQLRAAADVGSAAASLRNLDELLSQATELISQQFGFYHAGIFLIDARGEYAVLKAANSEGGIRMLARNHKLKVGEEGIVGYATGRGEARIALDVGQDAVFFDNPDLPQTRSEMALPLIAGGKTLGALDIQSTEGEAFAEADIATLQVLADQIAVAIENAHLFEENRIALAAVRRAYGEQSHLGWQELIHKEKNYGYRSGRDGNIFPLEDKVEGNTRQAMQENQMVLGENDLTVNIPISVRGESVGVIRLSKPDNAQSWDQKGLDLAQTLTMELSRAMDSARLFDEARQQADRERVVGEIANRMQETMNVESVVQLAADELFKLLKLEHITIHLSPENNQEEEIA